MGFICADILLPLVKIMQHRAHTHYLQRSRKLKLFPAISVASSASELACSIRTPWAAACKSAPLSAASICILRMRGPSSVEELEEVILVSVVVPIVL
jgi:hypothetical protein